MGFDSLRQYLRGVLGKAEADLEPPVEAEPPDPPSREALQEIVNSFPNWYQRVYLGQGVYTLDEPTYNEGIWREIRTVFPPDLRGRSVLDVGANAGYFSIKMKLLGAERVVGVESYPDALKQAELCRRIWDLDIEYRAADVDRMRDIDEQFDLVLFLGILYHLKAPLLALENIGRVCRDAIVVETEVVPADTKNCVYVRLGPRGRVRKTKCTKGMMKFIEGDELNSDSSNWWIPDTECVMGMLRTAGFKYFSTPYYFWNERLILVASKKKDSTLDLQALG